MTIIDDPIIEDDEDDAPDGPTPDAPPETDEPGVAICPECSQRFEGMLRMAHMASHRKRKHPEEWDAEHQPSAPKTSGAPRKKAAPRADAAPRGSGGHELRSVHENVVLFYTMGGSVLSFRDETCGKAIQQSAENAAKAWVELAKTNAKVRAFWLSDGGSTGWLRLAMAHVPIALAIQGHHVVPMLERRKARRETGMMEFDDGPLIDTDQAVTYNTDGPADFDGLGDLGDEPPLILHTQTPDSSPFAEGALG